MWGEGQEKNYFVCFLRSWVKSYFNYPGLNTVEQKDFVIIGRIVAASILLSGCSPHCFPPIIADFLAASWKNQLISRYNSVHSMSNHRIKNKVGLSSYCTIANI